MCFLDRINGIQFRAMLFTCQWLNAVSTYTVIHYIYIYMHPHTQKHPHTHTNTHTHTHRPPPLWPQVTTHKCTLQVNHEKGADMLGTLINLTCTLDKHTCIRWDRRRTAGEILNLHVFAKNARVYTHMPVQRSMERDGLIWSLKSHRI